MIVHTIPANGQNNNIYVQFSSVDYKKIIKNDRIIERIKNIYIRSRNRIIKKNMRHAEKSLT